MSASTEIVLVMSFILLLHCLKCETADEDHCSNVGGIDITDFLVDFDLSDNVFFPMYSSQPHFDNTNNVSKVLILIHGVGDNADVYFCNGMSIIGERNDTLLLVPWFANEKFTEKGLDTEVFGKLYINHNQDQAILNQSVVDSLSESVYWNRTNWMAGANSFHSKSPDSSSYSILDSIIEMLEDLNNFPSLELITLVGFSGGAQFLNRYSWISTVGSEPSKVRFIISDASTFLYFDSRRPHSSCTPLYDTGNSITCPYFETPVFPTDVDPDDGAACSRYNTWKYGLSLPIGNYPYVMTVLSEPGLIQSRMNAWWRKDVRFIFGEDDTCNCNLIGYNNDVDKCTPPSKDTVCTPNALGTDGCCDTYPDTTRNWMNVNCEAVLQGTNRLQRGLLYVQYLALLRREAGLTGSVTYATVPGMGHSALLLLQSDVLQDWAFSSNKLENSFLSSSIASMSFSIIESRIFILMMCSLLILVFILLTLKKAHLSLHTRTFKRHPYTNISDIESTYKISVIDVAVNSI